MKMRSVFETLGFQEDEEAITDQRPAYTYHFGNLRLSAAEVTDGHLMPSFLFSGVWRGAGGRSITMVNFLMPIEVESFEQGVAWISFGIGKKFQPCFPSPWLADGRTWVDHLPWERDMAAYARRPQCSVEKDWFRVATKKLRPRAAGALEANLVWLSFDGETLRIAGCGETIIVPATGTVWDTRYAILAKQLDRLPTRLTSLVHVTMWDGRLSIGNRGWMLAQSEKTTSESA